MAASVNADTDTTFPKEVLLENIEEKKKTRMLNQFLLLTNVAQSEFVVNQLQDILMVSEHIISTHSLEHHFMYR